MNFTVTALFVALTSLVWLVHVTVVPGSFPMAGSLEQLCYFLTALSAARVLDALIFPLVFRRQGPESAASDLLQATISILLYGTAVVAWLALGLGFDVSKLLATSAIFSVIIGFALQATLGNLFSGLSLEIERPVRVGDYVRKGDVEGRVEALKWRSVFIRTPNDSRIILPNSALTSQPIEIFPYDRPTRHTALFQIDPKVEPDRILAIARDVLNSGFLNVCADPAPSVVLIGNEAGSPNLCYGARYYTLNFLDRSTTNSRLLARLWYALARQGIDMKADRLTLAPDDAPVSSGPFPDAPPERACLWPVLAEAGRRQLFGADEVIPADCVGFVLRGVLREERTLDPQDLADEVTVLLAQDGASNPRTGVSPEEMAAITATAVGFVGPVAGGLVQRFSNLTDDPYLIYHAVAASIESPEHRAHFLALAPARPSRLLGSGASFGWAEWLNGPAAVSPARRVRESAELLLIPHQALPSVAVPVDLLAALIAEDIPDVDVGAVADRLRRRMAVAV
ncbi:mechanosensitive ion channel domain-containing protein [Telmatospirillum sp.]|uniref:mechanosensitive ion channel family protein n=1 Tax=Telmatospirillum sp. TaxID=2079197 RepID=UPI002844AD54|nr:mechanosensitive ion channel domain-containing protein [Telmatospirillum sp.]MDR3441002.1 mechanosensitive ion channel [Telmatospirillum sp.]